MQRNRNVSTACQEPVWEKSHFMENRLFQSLRRIKIRRGFLYLMLYNFMYIFRNFFAIMIVSVS